MSALRIEDIVGKQCSFEGCINNATHIACGREYGDEPGHSKPAFYCELHTSKVIREGHPEYRPVCPNCTCEFGVN